MSEKIETLHIAPTQFCLLPGSFLSLDLFSNLSSFVLNSGVRRIYFSRGRNKFEGEGEIRGGRLAPEGRKKFFCPPCFLFCPLGRIRFCPPGRIKFCPPWDRTDKRRGQKTLLYLEKEGETFNNRSLSKSQLTVLFFFLYSKTGFKHLF